LSLQEKMFEMYRLNAIFFCKFVLLLSTQVAFRGFYSAVHNSKLYPSFVRSSGRAGRRYAQLFSVLADRYQWRKLVIFAKTNDQSVSAMVGFIRRSLVHSNLHVVIKSVQHTEKQPYFQYMKDIKEENDEAGCISVSVHAL